MKVGTFFVPQEMAPGIARHGIGFFKPGSRYRWPDACTPMQDGGLRRNKETKIPWERPNIRLVPLDRAAYEWLVECYGKEAVDEEHVGQLARIELAEKRATVADPPPDKSSKGKGKERDLGGKMSGAEAATAYGLANEGVQGDKADGVAPSEEPGGGGKRKRLSDS